MSQRLYTRAEIWRAKALACEPEQLLPDGRACGDCHEFNGCIFVLDEPPHRDDRRCLFSPSRFADKWRIRVDQKHEKAG